MRGEPRVDISTGPIRTTLGAFVTTEWDHSEVPETVDGQALNAGLPGTEDIYNIYEDVEYDEPIHDVGLLAAWVIVCKVIMVPAILQDQIVLLESTWSVGKPVPC